MQIFLQNQMVELGNACVLTRGNGGPLYEFGMTGMPINDLNEARH